MYEIQSNFIHTPHCYRENKESLNIGHLEKDRYYEHDCIWSIKNPSQQYIVNKNKSHKARENTDQEVN